MGGYRIEYDRPASYPDHTGCGFAYRVQNNNEGYTAILTNDAVRMGACTNGPKQCTLFGTTHGYGTGIVDVPNGSKARFSLAVNKDHAWVLVDGKVVSQYTLYTTRHGLETAARCAGQLCPNNDAVPFFEIALARRGALLHCQQGCRPKVASLLGNIRIENPGRAWLGGQD